MKASTRRKIEKRHTEYVLRKVEEFNNNGKMTVAIYCDAFFPDLDGVVMVVDNLARRLKDMCNIIAFVPRHKGRTYKRDYLVVGVKSTFLKSINYSLAMPGFDNDYFRVVRHARIDVIHCHSPFFLGKAAKSLHKRKKIPLITTFHSQYKKDIYKATKNNGLTAMVLKFIMRVFNASNEVWTMHKKSAQTICDYGYNGKIRLVPNATDFVYPTNANERIAALKSQHGIKDEKILLFVGRLVSQKNILFIAESLAKLKQKGDKFKMFFVGDGPDRAKLEEKIAKLGLEGDCVLLGSITDRELVASYYLFADLILFPSLYDVSSIIQIEGACMKTPTAFVEGSVTSCTVKHGENGYILPNNVEAYANAVHDIINDEAGLKAVGENARRDLYVTWDEVVENTFNAYKEIIEKQHN